MQQSFLFGRVESAYLSSSAYLTFGPSAASAELKYNPLHTVGSLLYYLLHYQQHTGAHWASVERSRRKVVEGTGGERKKHRSVK